VTTKPGHREELEGNRKTIAQGMPVDPGEPVATTGAFFAPTTGAIGHPAFPAPLFRGRRASFSRSRPRPHLRIACASFRRSRAPSPLARITLKPAPIAPRDREAASARNCRYLSGLPNPLCISNLLHVQNSSRRQKWQTAETGPINTGASMSIKAVVFDAYGTLYDVQSVAAVTEEAFPGYGEIITQIWRIKQLEYSWLRSLMRRYEDFSVLTRESLAYTLRILGKTYDEGVFARLMEKYLHLDLYPDGKAALAALKGRKLAILSNGSGDMLNALVRNSGLDRVLDATISVDSKRIFKPAPDAYLLIEEKLGVRPSDVLFVSSNPWDACGAKSFGLNVAWIERVPPEAMAQACIKNDMVAPLIMFKAIRTQMDELGVKPDYLIRTLSELPGVIAAHES
jgi:2-haloacid dehalogenase